MTTKRDELPTSYQSNLPRVSQIVEYAYPFWWEGRDRFLQWLGERGISYSEYMEEASEGGRYVHSKLEQYVLTGEKKYKKYASYISWGIDFLYDYKVRPIATEHYVKCKDYQWTIDLIWRIGKKKYILDWKSYWLAKDRWGLRWDYKKPYDKLKKARLQLSLYARIEKVNNIAVVELTPNGYHFHELELVPEEELSALIVEFNNNYLDEL